MPKVECPVLFVLPQIFVSLLIVGLCAFLGAGTALAKSPADPWQFPAGFSFKTIPWPASLEKNKPQIKVDAAKMPEWKTLWDRARTAARNGDLHSASEMYRQLMALKSGLDAANWEWANILFALGNYPKSQSIIELLAEHNPERSDYLRGLAVLDLRVDKLSLAAENFNRLYGKEPADINALAGTVYAYLTAGDLKEALPQLKKLVGVYENDRTAAPGVKENDLRQLLGELAYRQADYETAARQFTRLAADKTAAERLVLYAARSLEQLGKSAKAAGYWQRLLAGKPDMVEAHKRLAAYFERDGLVDKALPHLLFLHRQNSADASLLKRLGRCYVGLKKFSQALNYFQKYLLIKPNDHEAARFVVSLQAASGNKNQLLGALEHYFRLEPHPGKASLEKAAKLYGEKGLYRQALAVWRKLLDLTPDDPAILGAMAHNFLAVGKDEEALKVWRKLADISPNVIDVYRPMAALLERMGRRQELIEVLETIHDLKPAEQDITLKLAILYMQRHAYDQAGKLLRELSLAGCRQGNFFYWHGLWAEKQNDLLLALREYKVFLKTAPERRDVRARCMVIAGRLGKPALVREYFDALQKDRHGTAVGRDRILLQAAAAFEQSGSYDIAEKLFSRVMTVSFKTPGQPVYPLNRQAGDAILGMAEMYLHTERWFKAEQFWRMGLAAGRGRDCLPELFDLALRVGETAKAEEWYSLLRRQSGIDPWYLKLQAAKLQKAQGNTRQAAKITRSLLKLPADWGGSLSRADWLNRHLDLAQFLKGREPERAAALCRQVLEKAPRSLRAGVILASIGRTGGSCKLFNLNTMRAVELLDYARLAGKNNQPWLMARTAGAALKKMPDSLMAAIIVARSLTMRQSPAAVGAWAKLVAVNPANYFIATQAAKAAFLAGDPDKALRFCCSISPQSPEMVLLGARIRWMQNDWPTALRTYKDFLNPGVDELLRQTAEKFDVKLTAPAVERSFWQRISLAPPGSPLADSLMGTAMFSRLSASDRGRSANFRFAVCRLYSLYRWQNKFAAELLARESVRRRAYFTAQRRYEALLEQYPADSPLLFDLAGIYSQLGRLDDEAAIYDKLMAAGINFPGLSEDVRRNKLKRQPRTALTFGFLEEEGRNDYKDMRIVSQDAEFKLSPRTGEELGLHMARKNYHGVNADGILRSTEIMASYQARLLERLTVNLGGGMANLDRGGESGALWDLRATGKFGDKLSASASFKRQVVTDTITSVDRGIYKQDIGLGLSFEPLSRLALGGDYDRIGYSDDNRAVNYNLWSSFLVHSEPLFLQLRYRYTFKDFEDGSGSGPSPAGGVSLAAHPYWAPENYWDSRVGVYFKHILSPEPLNRDAPTCYTLEYYLGHDADGYGFQTAMGSFYLDFNSHFMMRARTELYSSAVYRKKQFSLSAIYRW